MDRPQPILVPPVENWFEDGQPRDSPANGAVSAYGNLKHIDDTYLEISRVETLMRGLGVFGGALALVFYAMFVSSLVFDDAFMVVFCIVIHVFLVLAIFLFRLDFGVPSDTPVRFNRRRRKVYIYEYVRKANPFARWNVCLKTFDWDDVSAEITRQAGYSGVTYAVRYALVLSLCRPGSLEVVDRVKIGGNTIMEDDMRRLWEYCRLYMEQGPASLPPQPLRPDDVNFRRCFFYFMPFLDPTAEGRLYRQRMSVFEWTASALMIFVFWLLLPLGLMRYAALKLSPRPKWPADIDVESRSAPAG